MPATSAERPNILVLYNGGGQKSETITSHLPHNIQLISIPVDHGERNFRTTTCSSFALPVQKAVHKLEQGMLNNSGQHIHAELPSDVKVIMAAHDIVVFLPSTAGVLEKPDNFEYWRQYVAPILPGQKVNFLGAWAVRSLGDGETPGDVRIFPYTVKTQFREFPADAIDTLKQEEIQNVAGGIPLSSGTLFYEGPIEATGQLVRGEQIIFRKEHIEDLSSGTLQEFVYGLFPELLEGLFHEQSGLPPSDYVSRTH